MENEHPANKNDNPMWGFIGTVVWGSLIALLFILTQTISLLVYAKLHYGDISEGIPEGIEFNGTALSIGTISTLIVCSLAILCAIKLKKNSHLASYLALNKIDASVIRHWISISVIFIILSDALTYILGKPIVPEFMASVYGATDHFWLLAIAIVIAAPVFEELFFRGFLLSGLAPTFIGPTGAIFITAITWAAIHQQYDLYGIATIFVLGIILGVARFKTGSLFIPILIHGFMNLIATIQVVVNANI